LIPNPAPGAAPRVQSDHAPLPPVDLAANTHSTKDEPNHETHSV
jgi:hypothetical protein